MAQASTDLVLADDEEGIEVGDVKIFGETFHVLKAVNMFKLLDVFDENNPAGMTKYIADAVIASERSELRSLIGRQRFLTTEDLITIFGDITEAQADDRPTKSSSASSSGSGRKAVSTRSAAT